MTWRIPPASRAQSSVLFGILTHNYKLVLDHTFQANESKGVSRKTSSPCLILEDDLMLADDALVSLTVRKAMMQDSSPLASGFSDNGFRSVTADASKILRGQPSAGQGWMIERRTWLNGSTHWTESSVWDTPFVQAVVKLHKEYCARSPSIHLGEGLTSSTEVSGGIGALTTTTAMQELLFDNTRIASMDDVMKKPWLPSSVLHHVHHGCRCC